MERGLLFILFYFEGKKLHVRFLITFFFLGASMGLELARWGFFGRTHQRKNKVLDMVFV